MKERHAAELFSSHDWEAMLHTLLTLSLTLTLTLTLTRTLTRTVALTVALPLTPDDELRRADQVGGRARVYSCSCSCS